MWFTLLIDLKTRIKIAMDFDVYFNVYMILTFFNFNLNVFMLSWNFSFFLYFLASYSTGFATSCQPCSAGYSCINQNSYTLCPFDLINSYTYSTDKSKFSYL